MEYLIALLALGFAGNILVRLFKSKTARMMIVLPIMAIMLYLIVRQFNFV